MPPVRMFKKVYRGAETRLLLTVALPTIAMGSNVFFTVILFILFSVNNDTFLILYKSPYYNALSIHLLDLH